MSKTFSRCQDCNRMEYIADGGCVCEPCLRLSTQSKVLLSHADSELEQLRQQLAAANARIGELEADRDKPWGYRLSTVAPPDPPGTTYPSIGETYELALADTGYADRVLLLKSKELDARIQQLESTIAALTERSDVRGKLAETFGEVLCQIAGTSDRVRACAIASERFAAMAWRLEQAEKLLDGRKIYWPFDSDGEQGSDDLETICDRYEVGETFSVQVALKLPDEFYVVETNHHYENDPRPATPEEIQAFKAKRRVESERRKAEFDRINAERSKPIKVVPMDTTENREKRSDNDDSGNA